MTTEIFPEDKTDPTVTGKEFHVEQTLGVMAHVRVIAKKRKWQFLQIDSADAETTKKVTEVGGEVSYIRSFYQLPETAAVTHKDGVWAVWSGEGEPTTEAFPEYAPVDEGPGSEFLKGLQARLGIEQKAAEFVKAQEPGEPVKEGAVALALSPLAAEDSKERLLLEGESAARNAAYKRAQSDAAYETSSKSGQNAWAYSSIHVTDHVAMRRRYGTGNDAVIEMHPSGGIAAIWLGKNAPTRPAFPDVQPAPEGLGLRKQNGTNINDFHAEPMPPVPAAVPTVPAPFLDSLVPSDLPPPVKVSGHVPSAALNEMGVKLYGLSKEPLYSAEFRQYLSKVSDSLHAEAARIELSKMRAKLDARDRPLPVTVPLARLTGEK